MAFWSPGRFRKTFLKDIAVSAAGAAELASAGIEEETAVRLSEAQLSLPQGFAGALGEAEVAEASWRQAACPVSAMVINKAANRVIRNTE